MTPGARIAAAIDILDEIIGGTASEAALTRWARTSRFAGSKDRAAVRDHVFDAVRNLRSFACLGGGTSDNPTGRAIMIGAARKAGWDLDALFTGSGYAPDVVADHERPNDPAAQSDVWNIPAWMIPLLEESLGADVPSYIDAMGERAPIFLRANLQKTDVSSVLEALLAEGIDASHVPGSLAALRVHSGERKIKNSRPYRDGWVELQDAQSQAIIDWLDLKDVTNVLDYCAGGGGKALALAAAGVAEIDAHDVSPKRMSDIPVRAQRAGVNINVCTPADLKAGYDLVVVDAPCSGSGSWRRAPDGKWKLTPENLEELIQTQQEVLCDAAERVRDGGELVYITCSVFNIENERQTSDFTEKNSWRIVSDQRWHVSDKGDGFYAARLMRA